MGVYRELASLNKTNLLEIEHDPARIRKFREEVEGLSEIGVTAFSMYGDAGAGLVRIYLKDHIG
ncbi:MAG: hypothetical protein IPL26_15740 [Leptospiraceae bacterium]|nr:hypothetical protein [Leptospiraceae bacterium]